MKNVVIFGATGFTGQNVVSTALELGLKVRVFVRDPARLAEDLRSQVEVVQGDVLQPEEVEKAVVGQDAVVVTLGTRNDLAATTMMSDGLKNILAAMKKNNVKSFLFFETDKVPPRFIPLTEDHRRMSNALKASTDIDWIAVYPPHIADTPGSDGGYTVSHETEPSSTFRGRLVSVKDLAHFLVKSLSMAEHYKQVCGIAT
ncbi:hypothetical protein B566_EDAN005047 [Ephemera danica]|nr:hypothetical protein B566_EDAN005047 [Ephemera danica]